MQLTVKLWAALNITIELRGMGLGVAFWLASQVRNELKAKEELARAASAINAHSEGEWG